MFKKKPSKKQDPKPEVVKLGDNEETKKTFDATSEFIDPSLLDSTPGIPEEGWSKKEHVENKDIRHFKYGDLQFQCYRCGHRETVDRGIEHGIQLVLPANDQQKLTLVCNRCGNKMELFFTENTTKEKELAEEKVKEEALEKAKKKSKKKGDTDERTKEDNKEEKSV